MPRAFVISAPALLTLLERIFKLNIGFLSIGSANVISRRLLEGCFHDLVGNRSALIKARSAGRLALAVDKVPHLGLRRTTAKNQGDN